MLVHVPENQALMAHTINKNMKGKKEIDEQKVKIPSICHTPLS